MTDKSIANCDDADARISPNTLAFIALSNEYCRAIENAPETERDDFLAAMTRLLPRLYITASDIPQNVDIEEAECINALDEDMYDSTRRGIESLLGEDDTYLEVFEEDMKYSDTPIGASISEGLADIFQVLYDYLETVRDAPARYVSSVTYAVHDDFQHYWSQKLCNVLRAINAVRYC